MWKTIKKNSDDYNAFTPELDTRSTQNIGSITNCNLLLTFKINISLWRRSSTLAHPDVRATPEYYIRVPRSYNSSHTGHLFGSISLAGMAFIATSGQLQRGSVSSQNGAP